MRFINRVCGPKERTGRNSLEKTVCKATVEIKNADGLHMRPAMQFVDIANRFDCDINVSDGKDSVDGKSIMQMTMLAATHGTKLEIVARGHDAEKAVSALSELIEQRMFNEHPPENVKQ